MENFFEIKLNINQISELVGMHRQTVSQRIAGLTPSIGSNQKLKLYALPDLIRLGLQEKMTADVVKIKLANNVNLLGAWRIYRNLSQQEVADKLGISQGAVSQMEHKENKPLKRTT